MPGLQEQAGCGQYYGWPLFQFCEGPGWRHDRNHHASIVARKVHLIIPVGLEKQVAGDLVDLTLKMREPMESLNDLPSMWLLTGEIVTELEAIKMLTGATAFQVNAGVSAAQKEVHGLFSEEPGIR